MELFELSDLPALLQVPEVDTASADLVRRLATDEIRGAVGWARFHAVTVVGGVVPAGVERVALELAQRLFRNPEGLSSMTVGEMSVTYTGNRSAPSLGGLSREQRETVRRAYGCNAAFSVPTRAAW